FNGIVASVDGAGKTITLATKGEQAGMVVHLSSDAIVTVDGKDAKLGDVAKGMNVTLVITALKDGQPSETSAVIVAGQSFDGTVKALDNDTITIGNPKFEKTVRLAPAGKVTIDGKEAKLSDLKGGDQVRVTLTADNSASIVIAAGKVDKPTDQPAK